ncbi:hypothetical protein [Clostridium sp.]|jgi:hypothetical protein|uniref:hypothetical protein n=1 Tax=Clostridium sp. TaxID=1506 RepID=UPI002585B35C|nr:hypothetical protein [Clostridium sp.]MDF2503882.1 hypothetical protein [Clostridium sp.]
METVKNVRELLEKGALSRLEIAKLGGDSSRKSLITLERQGLIKKEEVFANNCTNPKLKDNKGTRFYKYSLVEE